MKKLMIISTSRERGCNKKVGSQQERIHQVCALLPTQIRSLILLLPLMTDGPDEARPITKTSGSLGIFFFWKKKKYSPFFMICQGKHIPHRWHEGRKKKRKRRRNPDCWWLFLLASPTSSITAANWGFTFWIFLSVRKIFLKATQRTPEKRDVQLRASRLCSFD